ncbi:TetR family transcriptional regulator [Streptomyces pactum]|uniref:TetR family transcriptional regulator n=1 Tax=Streptomyces pactum TaxID=68249 RepID=A0ABS0NHH8_9ACTN|nr:TetR family transcriptional regulator [Streptomyces pactum]MBH5334649.1 TetR family transcriptional regulator [Streptomyces pactum]
MAAERPAARVGLREHKKRRTRDALITAALELFTRQGYERTTVEEIAAAVDISQRTFFRYFGNKEEVAFAVQDVTEAHILASLCARPAGEPPFTALHNAALDAWETFGEAIESVVPVEVHLRMYQLIESTPALLAVHLRRGVELEERLAREIARREGVDVDADPRPRLVVAALSGAMRVAGRLWGEGPEPTLESLRAIAAVHLEQLGPALLADWHGRDAAPAAPAADTHRGPGGRPSPAARG